jgi:RNA-directed DNA polymerase
MHINKEILHNKLKVFINQKYFNDDKEDILWLVKKVISNDPTKNCIIKGKRGDWDDLPKNKSLFHSPPNCGLPIGNLTSQIFANFYMNGFDHYMKNELGLKNYGRYVDDFIVVHEDKEFLLKLKNLTESYLRNNLDLTIHPKKTTIQEQSKGVSFLGAYIKPNRLYTGRRTKGNFWWAIKNQNDLIKKRRPTIEERKTFQSSMNSYLGYVKHHKSFKLKYRMILEYLIDDWFEFFWVETDLMKFKKRKKRKYSYL